MPFKPLNQTLQEPTILDSIPKDSQWLAGEGAGSWFHLSVKNHQYLIVRYSQQGKIECSGVFEITNDISLDITAEYLFTHLSHCKNVTILQNDKVVKLSRI